MPRSRRLSSLQADLLRSFVVALAVRVRFGLEALPQEVLPFPAVPLKQRRAVSRAISRLTDRGLVEKLGPLKPGMAEPGPYRGRACFLRLTRTGLQVAKSMVEKNSTEGFFVYRYLLDNGLDDRFIETSEPDTKECHHCLQSMVGPPLG